MTIFHEELKILGVKDSALDDYAKELVDGEAPKVFMWHPPSDSLVCAEDLFSKSSW